MSKLSLYSALLNSNLILISSNRKLGKLLGLQAVKRKWCIATGAKVVVFCLMV